MPTCKDCVHYKICPYDSKTHELENCKYFKDVADLVPRSEVDALEYTLLGVMHSVDKWLEGDELKQDEVNRAITMREKTLRIVESAKSEVAREIFAEIERVAISKIDENAPISNLDDIAYIQAIDEVREKYIGGDA